MEHDEQDVPKLDDTEETENEPEGQYELLKNPVTEVKNTAEEDLNPLGEEEKKPEEGQAAEQEDGQEEEEEDPVYPEEDGGAGHSDASIVEPKAAEEEQLENIQNVDVKSNDEAHGVEAEDETEPLGEPTEAARNDNETREAENQEPQYSGRPVLFQSKAKENNKEQPEPVGAREPYRSLPAKELAKRESMVLRNNARQIRADFATKLEAYNSKKQEEMKKHSEMKLLLQQYLEHEKQRRLKREKDLKDKRGRLIAAYEENAAARKKALEEEKKVVMERIKAFDAARREKDEDLRSAHKFLN